MFNTDEEIKQQVRPAPSYFRKGHTNNVYRFLAEHKNRIRKQREIDK